MYANTENVWLPRLQLIATMPSEQCTYMYWTHVRAVSTTLYTSAPKSTVHVSPRQPQTPPFKKGRHFACYCRRPNSHVSHESSRHGLLPQLNPALRCAHHIHVHDHTIGTELTMHAARHVIHAAPVLQLRQERLASQIVELALGCCPSAMKWARWPWALTRRQATLEERQSDFVVAGW